MLGVLSRPLIAGKRPPRSGAAMLQCMPFPRFMGITPILCAAAFLLTGPGPIRPAVEAQVSQRPVVPGGEGFGMQTRAAYGSERPPVVLRVTNLNDSGIGSLRSALEASFPRIVIFEISGYIDLNDTIRINSPYLTVAGQTAPSPGITIRRYGIELRTHDVLLQHFRIRPGEWGQGREDNSGIIAWGFDAHDIVLDHLSVSWGPDENIAADAYGTGEMNMTVWRCITAEGLDYPRSSPSSASHGLLVQANSRKVYIAQSLFASNRERNPYMQSETSVVAVNNLIFNAFENWHFFFANYTIDGLPGGPPWSASVVGNRIITGPNTDGDKAQPQAWLFYYDDTGKSPAGNQIFRSDNTVDNAYGMLVDEQGNELTYDPNVSQPPVTAPIDGIEPMRSDAVEAFVTTNAGARPVDRDPVDQRIITDVSRRTSSGYIRSQNDVGGYPPLQENRRRLIVPTRPNDLGADGYTNLERWLQSFAKSVEPTSPNQTATVAAGSARRRGPDDAAIGTAVLRPREHPGS